MLEKGDSKMIAGLNELAEKVHENAVKHGWWEEAKEFGTLLA